MGTEGNGVCLVESISKDLWLTQRDGEGLEKKLREETKRAKLGLQQELQ